MTKEQMLSEIKEKIGTTWIGIPGHSVCQHHLLMIGDALDWIEKIKDQEYEMEMSHFDNLHDLWKEKRKPLHDQSEDCITYIHSLIK